MPKKSALLVIFLTVFIDLLGFGMVLPLLPIYAKQFARQFELAEQGIALGVLIGLLMSSFSAMQFLFAPMWGRLSDRIGRRPVILIGLAGSVVFYALFGLATAAGSIVWLFVSRIGAGVAGATIPTAHAYIADVTPHDRRAKGMALIGAAFGLGFTFGPLFGALALPSGEADAGPGPGYAAAALSALALVLAWFKLPETLDRSRVAPRRVGAGFAGLHDALATPSIGPLLLAMFVCVFAFANFESTLSLLVKDEAGAFRFSFREVMLAFAFVGFTLALAQGLIVRRLATRISETAMATLGALVELVGFWLLIRAADATSTRLLVDWNLAGEDAAAAWRLTLTESTAQLLAALVVVVVGFALITPALNALISRRSDPARQGSASSLARILGPLAGSLLYHSAWLGEQLGVSPVKLPSLLAGGMMAVGLVLVLVSSRRGRDFVDAAPQRADEAPKNIQSPGPRT
jgi:MFS transporter, DHA1 family, tetracycline resistance protein